MAQEQQYDSSRDDIQMRVRPISNGYLIVSHGVTTHCIDIDQVVHNLEKMVREHILQLPF